MLTASVAQVHLAARVRAARGLDERRAVFVAIAVVEDGIVGGAFGGAGCVLHLGTSVPGFYYTHRIAAYVKHYFPPFKWQGKTGILSRQMGKKIPVTITRTIDLAEMGRMGRLGGTATARNRTSDERKAAACAAIKARWEAYYASHPEKRATARTKQSRASAPASNRKAAAARKKAAK